VIKDAETLSIHTGAIDDTFPQYAVALALSLLVDRTPYKLQR
jgi:hypothetical protein